MSRRRVVSEGDVRVVVQEALSSGPSSFIQFHNTNSSFVDKTLAIEAFLRNPGSHHLILRPRRCGKSFTLSMIREFLQRPARPELGFRDIATTQFEGTAITDPIHSELVSKYFKQYPVLYIDLKNVRGTTYENMLISFDELVCDILDELSDPSSGLAEENFLRFCDEFRNGTLQAMRGHALKVISRNLYRVCKKLVVVLIDEYDSPMHSAIEHGYADLASNFFATVFGSLLKGNDAVSSSMMVGICRVVKSCWMSMLNNIKVFPMDASDDRYAKFFLFTEKEVEILCETHSRGLSIGALQARYNGYTARCGDEFVKLYNPLSVVRALETNRISNFWVETGQHSPLSKNLWRDSPAFHSDLGLLLTQKSVKLEVDDQINFSSYDDISDSGLWGLLYYTGYLTIQGIETRSSNYIFRIPNEEVASEWHEWMVGFDTHKVT